MTFPSKMVMRSVLINYYGCLVTMLGVAYNINKLQKEQDNNMLQDCEASMKKMQDYNPCNLETLKQKYNLKLDPQYELELIERIKSGKKLRSLRKELSDRLDKIELLSILKQLHN